MKSIYYSSMKKVSSFSVPFTHKTYQLVSNGKKWIITDAKFQHLQSFYKIKNENDQRAVAHFIERCIINQQNEDTLAAAWVAYRKELPLEH